MMIPIATLIGIAFAGDFSLWPHLLASVLPRAAWNTLILLTGVGVLTGTIGCGTAWLVSAYHFPGRGIFEWALILPLAVPTYIVAFAYLDLLHPVGPVQTWLRWLLGYDSPRQLILPDIRSMAGCILVLSFVLYPYVYVMVRTMFVTQAANLVDVSRTLGASYSGAFWRVALPLARPALSIGIALVLMETLNDIGASEFLGIQTLTVSIYTTWVTRSDLAGAAQIALVLLLFVLTLISIERWGRRRQSFALSALRPRRMEPRALGTWTGLLALCAVSLPVLAGFAMPALYLAFAAFARMDFIGISPALLNEVSNTVLVSLAGTASALFLGLVVSYAARTIPGRLSLSAARLSMIGYAVPGTVLAIGVLFCVTAFDRTLAQLAALVSETHIGLLILGSGSALVIAYTLRFLAIATGGFESGFSRIPDSIDGVARTLGAGSWRTLTRVHIPMLRPALAAAAILIFVDCMKELPATLLLRPLNFETLATHLYGEAARGTYEDGSIAALFIVVVGLLPVIILARSMPRTPKEYDM
ncbi:iron(III) transport system permease protein [Rhodoligotrophos appendicifer]